MLFSRFHYHAAGDAADELLHIFQVFTRIFSRGK